MAGVEVLPLRKRYGLSVKVNGVRKYTQLYRRWKDLRSRTQGKATRTPHLYLGLPIGWTTFAEFRAFAVANGFRKNTSPDRINSALGYVPENVRFIPFAENWAKTTRNAQSDYAVRGEEPPAMIHGPECDCDPCRRLFGD